MKAKTRLYDYVMANKPERISIPSKGKIGYENLVMAAILICCEKDLSPEETIDILRQLEISPEDARDAFERGLAYFASRN